ncbi:MAG: ATP synthase A1 subunit C [Candidatus Burarchaeum sp.]|nr:ATP synthase A1 subunit C [Candidatus Burarchaeum sp.]MDO8339260.1 ATP synthase A1 subunit C [Candidatus Burarchaeum sp.]
MRMNKGAYAGASGWLRGAYGRLAFNTLRYAYSNARVKGMRAHLLSQQQIEELTAARSVEELMGMLNNMGYREDFVKPAVKYGGADLVELALGRNMARTFTKVLGFTPKHGKATVAALIDKWDVHNIKTILLAKSVGEDSKRIEPFLVNAGSLGEDKVGELLRKENVKGVVEELQGTEYREPLAETYGEYEKRGEISVLLTALDSFYYARLPSRIRASHRDEHVILGLVKTEVDAKNIMNVLRARKAGMKAEAMRGMLVGTGTLAKRDLEALIECENIEAIVAELRRNYDLQGALEKFRQDSSLAHFEVELERRIVERGLLELRRSMFSVGAIASFLFLKEQEIGNIRKIVRGVEFGVPREEIKVMVVSTGA